MKRILLLIMATCAAGATVVQGQNHLIAGAFNNGNFDADTAGGPPAVWDLAPSGGSISVSSAYALSGSNSLVIDSTGAGAWSAPNAFQLFPATPGTEFTLTGSMLLSSAITDASFGVLKIEFKNSLGANLEPASISIGQLDGAGQAWVGAISNIVNNTTATEFWVDAEVQAVAPPGTVEVGFYLLNVNAGAAPGPIYFDSITAIPEPSTYALIGGLFALGIVIYRRRMKA